MSYHAIYIHNTIDKIPILLHFFDTLQKKRVQLFNYYDKMKKSI